MFDDLRVDFSNVEGQRSFEPIPASRQTVVITGWEAGEVTGEEAKHKGAPKLTLEYTISGDPEENKFANRKLWDTFVVVESSLWKLKAMLAAIGEDVSGELNIEPEEYVGRELEVKIGLQPARKNPSTGEEYAARNKVQAYFPVSESASMMP